MVIESVVGEIVVLAFIAMLFGPEYNGWPTALYAVSTLLVVVYSIWCNLLTAAVF